jgi:hypothetical protein
MNGRFFNSVQILQACPKSHKPLRDKRNLVFFKSFNLSTGATHARLYRESSIERLKDLNDSYFIYINQMVSCRPSPLNFVEAFERSPARAPVGRRGRKHSTRIRDRATSLPLPGAGTSPVRQLSLEDAMSLPIRFRPANDERRRRLTLNQAGDAARRLTQAQRPGGLR